MIPRSPCARSDDQDRFGSQKNETGADATTGKALTSQRAHMSHALICHALLPARVRDPGPGYQQQRLEHCQEELLQDLCLPLVAQAIPKMQADTNLTEDPTCQGLRRFEHRGTAVPRLYVLQAEILSKGDLPPKE